MNPVQTPTPNDVGVDGSFADEAMFEAFAKKRSWEPGWLAEKRREAWERFRSLPPTYGKDERWRFSPRNRLSLTGFSIANGKEIPDPSAIEIKDPDLAAKGVIHGSLNEVLMNQPDLLKDLANQSGPNLGADSVQLLTEAFSEDGMVLRVPQGVQIEQPIVVRHKAPPPGQVRFHRTLFVLEEGASATLLETFHSQEEEDCSVICSSANVIARPNAQARRILLQDLNLKSSFYQLDTNEAHRDAGIRCCSLHIGSAQSRFENLAKIAGEGADLEMLGLAIGSGKQLFDQRTRQLHIAPNGRSNLLYKNALLDDSKAVFSGLIKVDETAQQTNAYQTNRNLLLSPSAEADSLPGLEILANEVKCSHGATTGEIDEEQLFYLRSRGIPKNSAEELLVFGFLEEVLEGLRNEELAEILREHIQTKFN